MIVLDTNVLSALMRAEPDRAVVGWLDRQAADEVWTTTVTVLEVRTGIELLAEGRRRRGLEEAFRAALAEELGGRVLPFDEPAAQAAGTLAARRQREGRPVEIRDTQIAGIVLARRARLATRNLRHFEDLGVGLTDPWEG